MRHELMSNPRSIRGPHNQRDLSGIDPITAHLIYEPLTTEFTSIPWPQGTAPVPDGPDSYRHGAPLPEADVLVVTWTKAEWEALADVLTPGYQTHAWAVYTHEWDLYKGQFSWRSPAKEAQCLGQYKMTKIGNKKVLCFHSELHLATDATSAPIVQLWKQIVAEAKPSLVVTTGTAGGIGESTVLGDVFIVANAKFNCAKMFKSKTWAQERYESTPPVAGPSMATANASLITVNAPKLRPIATRDPIIAIGGDVETVDYFGFDDTDDSYGIVSNDADAHTEEMDDATLPLALSEISALNGWGDGTEEPAWLSIRNASDPEVPSSIGTLEEQSKWASKIYEQFGYYTTVGSAIACWAVISDLED